MVYQHPAVFLKSGQLKHFGCSCASTTGPRVLFHFFPELFWDGRVLQPCIALAYLTGPLKAIWGHSVPKLTFSRQSGTHLNPQALNSLSYDPIKLKAPAAGTTKQHGEVPRHTQGRLGCNPDTYTRPMYALLPLGVSDFPYVPQYRDFDRSNRTKAAGTSGWSRGSG